MNGSVFMSSLLGSVTNFSFIGNYNNSNRGYLIPDSVDINDWKVFALTVAAFALFLALIVCGLNCKCILLILSISRKSAYNNLVQHGFFAKWIIRDLSGLTYNPEGPVQPPEE